MSSNAECAWKQSPGGKWVKTDSSASHVAISEDECENTLCLPASAINTATNSFICGVCNTAMHFRKLPLLEGAQCSVCSQQCGNIQLVCDRCELCICCNGRVSFFLNHQDSKRNCYNSYFDPKVSVREQLYNQQMRVSEFDEHDQQHWLQCMWQDIMHSMNKFRAELEHAAKVDTVSASSVNLVMENLGIEMTKGLVRLFIIFQSKFDADIVEWFSSLILHGRESLGSVAIESSLKLKGRLEQMKWLIIELGLYASNCELSSAVEVAAETGRLNALECLLEHARADPSANDNYAIRAASDKGHLNIVERLLQDDRVDPAAEDNCAIREASKKGHLNIVERLLQDDRVNPAAEDNFSIRFASMCGHLSIVDRLLQDDRVDPTAIDNYAIRLASEDGRWNIVERLLQDGRVDPAANDNYALRMASQFGHFQVVHRLLQDGRVDPAAKGCEAIRIANDHKILECLFARTRSIVCYMTGDGDLMKKLTHLHNESLMLGGLCLSHVGSWESRTTTLPPDLVVVILLKWASLPCVQDGVNNSEQNDS